jgi:hypothetical protein
MRGATSYERTARILMFSGVATIVAGVVLGLVVEPVLFAIAAVGVMDLVVARVLASGRVGQASVGSAADEHAPADADADPSYNPYARED